MAQQSAMNVPGGRVAIACGLMLAACTTPPGPAPAPPPPAVVRETSPPSAADLALAAFVSRQREHAALAARQGHWADAIWSCDVLLALDPHDTAALAARAQARNAAAAAVADRLPRAQQAWQRGDLSSAKRLYLEVLVVAPDHAGAAEALRKIELARTLRGNVPGNRVSVAAPPRGKAPASPLDQGAAATVDRNDLEHASMLASQGDLDAAIAMLQPLANDQQADPATRTQLADLYFRRAERLQATDKTGAIGALDQCLRLQPGHRQAKAMLKTLRAPTIDRGAGAGHPPATPSR